MIVISLGEGNTLIDVGPALLPGVLAVMDRQDYYTVQRCDAAAGARKSFSLLTSEFVRRLLRWVSSKAFSRESNSKLKSKRKENNGSSTHSLSLFHRCPQNNLLLNGSHAGLMVYLRIGPSVRRNTGPKEIPESSSNLQYFPFFAKYQYLPGC